MSFCCQSGVYNNHIDYRKRGEGPKVVVERTCQYSIYTHIRAADKSYYSTLIITTYSTTAPYLAIGRIFRRPSSKIGTNLPVL